MFVREQSLLASSPHLLRHIDEMNEIFDRADASTKEFALSSKLTCPPGCGACCNNPSVEATVAELLPLAVEIVAQGAEEEIHTRAAAGTGSRCILFQQVGSNENSGRCTRYEGRPLICRMFGYAGVRSHGGEVAFAACKVLKATQPEDVKNAPTPPLMTNYAMQALALSQSGGFSAERLPINEALMRAIEYVALRCYIRAQEQVG